MFKNYSILFLTLQYVHSFRTPFVSPVDGAQFEDQILVLLVDINSADTSITMKGVKETHKNEGYDPSQSGSFKNLSTRYNVQLDSTVNYNSASFSEYLAQDINCCDEKMNKFFLVDHLDGDISTTYSGDSEEDGRLGINPWIKSKTRLSTIKSVDFYSLYAYCRVNLNLGFCEVNQDFDRCLKFTFTDPSPILIPVTPNEKHFWQVEGDSYKYDILTYNNKFNILFSTTIRDIIVPKMLFNMIGKLLKVRNVGGNYMFDCSARELLKEITLKLNGNEVVIQGKVYTDQMSRQKEVPPNERGECYLRLNPGKGNDWVLGLQFYYAYGACFKGKEKQVQLYKNPFKELPRDDY